MPPIVHYGNDVLRTYVDIPACNFAVRPQDKRVFGHFLGMLKFKIAFLFDEGGCGQSAHSGSWSGPRVFQGRPYSHTSQTIIRINQDCCLRLFHEHVSALNDACIVGLLFTDATQNNSELSDIYGSDCRHDGGDNLKMISDPNKGDNDKIVTGAIVVVGF